MESDDQDAILNHTTKRMVSMSSDVSTTLRSRTAKIDLQRLTYAVAAAEHGSFRQAAEALLLRQSTLSRSIRELEEAIGVIVFDRSSGGVRATHAGHPPRNPAGRTN
jgi:DNA-binding MarR family transcriptional regulator